MMRKWGERLSFGARIAQLEMAAVALVGLIPWGLGFERIRAWADSMAADGNAEFFTPSFFQTFRWIGIGGAVFFSLLLLLSFLFPQRFQAQFTSVVQLPAQTRHDMRQFFRSLPASLRLPGKDAGLLVLIMVMGIVIRLLVIMRPMQHDEAYTVVTWASGSLRYAASDYHLPNNHVFHTILVNLIYHLFGKSPWLMRFPALMAGILLIPASFYLGKSFYSVPSGLFTAAMVSVAPFLVDYSTNARGYALFALFSVLLFLMGKRLISQKNRFLWALTILIASLGFYTLPTMLYPYGAFCVWMGLSAFFAPVGRGYAGRVDFLKHLIVHGICVILLSGLLYLPILQESGVQALFGNVFVLPLSKEDFLPTFFSRWIDFMAAFSLHMAEITWVLLLIGSAAALVLHREICHVTVPVQFGFALWLIPVWLIQRPNLWVRTQIYFWAFLLLWGFAGMIAGLEKLFSVIPELAIHRRRDWIVYGLTGLSVLGVATGELGDVLRIHSTHSLHQEAIQIVTEREKNPDDFLFVVAPADDASVWYYADWLGLPKSIFDRNRPYKRVYVYVNRNNEGYNEPRTVDDVIRRYGPGDAFVEYSTQQNLMFQLDGSLILLDANMRVIEKTFGKP